MTVTIEIKKRRNLKKQKFLKRIKVKMKNKNRISVPIMNKKYHK